MFEKWAGHSIPELQQPIVNKSFLIIIATNKDKSTSELIRILFERITLDDINKAFKKCNFKGRNPIQVLLHVLQMGNIDLKQYLGAITQNLLIVIW